MCNYVNLTNGQCQITKSTCPYVYFCNRLQTYKVLSSMPSDCKIKEKLEIPKGYYKVCFERRGKLYVDIDNSVKIIENPYNYVPLYVKVTKYKNGKIKIRQAMGWM